MKYTFLTRFSVAAVALICLSACLSTRRSNAYWKEVTPGGVRIDTNLFYDQSELANIHWREYEYWTRRVFGANSQEYRAALADNWVWQGTDTCLYSFIEYYHIHPAYDYYPIVGVSQKQAEDFSKWRSDRVFEGVLLLHHKIKEDTAQNRDTYFTIEKYYAGKYQNAKPDSNFRYYPDYRLPRISEWKRVDSIDHIYGTHYPPRIGYVPCLKTGKDADPTVPAGYYRRNRDRQLFYHLRGNVSEWTSEKGVCIGGGWADKDSVLAAQDTFHLYGVNAWTGFRNVCEWREYKMK